MELKCIMSFFPPLYLSSALSLTSTAGIIMLVWAPFSLKLTQEAMISLENAHFLCCQRTYAGTHVYTEKQMCKHTHTRGRKIKKMNNLLYWSERVNSSASASWSSHCDRWTLLWQMCACSSWGSMLAGSKWRLHRLTQSSLPIFSNNYCYSYCSS